MANIWKEHLDMLMAERNNNTPKQNFEKLLKKCNSSLAAIHAAGITDDNRSELIGLMGFSIQLQTAIAILSKLDASGVMNEE
jgi:hypothetical protein